MGNQYLKALTILVSPEILGPLEISGQFKRTPHVQLNIIPDPIHKNGFTIYNPVRNCNFPSKLAHNKYVCV